MSICVPRKSYLIYVKASSKCEFIHTYLKAELLIIICFNIFSVFRCLIAPVSIKLYTFLK